MWKKFTFYKSQYEIIMYVLYSWFRSAIKMRKKEVIPKDIYISERETDANSKDLLNLVVVGHVDSGKSTLMGHLLVELGQGKS